MLVAPVKGQVCEIRVFNIIKGSAPPGLDSSSHFLVLRAARYLQHFGPSPPLLWDSQCPPMPANAHQCPANALPKCKPMPNQCPCDCFRMCPAATCRVTLAFPCLPCRLHVCKRQLSFLIFLRGLSFFIFMSGLTTEICQVSVVRPDVKMQNDGPRRKIKKLNSLFESTKATNLGAGCAL